MTKEFVTKMIAAKRLECEALRELLPENIRDDLDQIGAGLKEAAMEWVREAYFSPAPDPNRETEKKNAAATPPNGGAEKARKITID